MRPLFIVSVVYVFSSLQSTAALACATCLCGDPTITTMGTEKPFAGRLRAGIDHLRRKETVAEPGVSEVVTEEERVTYSLSYAVNAEWIVAASLPLVSKEIRRYDLSRENASGAGDIDLAARWFLSRDEGAPARDLWGLQFGLRLPTSTEQKAGGEVINFDAQPGAGAVIPGIGAWYGRYAMPWFGYASAVVQHAVTDGYQGYRAGDVLLVTTLAQYAVNYRLALQFSLDGRFKRQDAYDGVTDENSGGVLVMATPGVAWTPLEDLVVNANYQIPAIENANGRQEESATLRAGFTYDF